MSQHQAELERQLTHARAALGALATKLPKGIAPADRRRLPAWRRLSARVAQIQARLKTVAEFGVVAKNLEQRKVEKAAAEAAAKLPQPKAEKKKKSAEKPPKKEKKEKEPKAKQPDKQEQE